MGLMEFSFHSRDLGLGVSLVSTQPRDCRPRLRKSRAAVELDANLAEELENARKRVMLLCLAKHVVPPQKRIPWRKARFELFR